MSHPRPLPLLTHPTPEAIVAWRQGQPITRQQFLADVQQLAARYPAGGHILNVCHDRYHFAVGLAAAVVSGKVSLLPSSLAPEMVEQLRRQAPDLFYLRDLPGDRFELPVVDYPTQPAAATAALEVPLINPQQKVARLFTSGSTGTPQPHDKHWGALVKNVQAEAALLPLRAEEPNVLIGTVPPQHMFGFESTVMLALQSGQALSADHPFYPADIVAAIEAVPHPRLLITTPFHLKSLLTIEQPLPRVERMICATAPLSLELAQQAEQRLQSALFEIYGSTETGQIAMRRTTLGPEWRLFPGIELQSEGDHVWASGGHVEQRVMMNDLLELLGERRFRLHGRTADLINIAGKRSSLAYLNHQLTTIPGVSDGAFYMPDEESPDGITRLIAVVVAPTLTQRALREQLRSRIDAAFMPRPIHFVKALPRSASGKLPRSALQQLLQQLAQPQGATLEEK